MPNTEMQAVKRSHELESLQIMTPFSALSNNGFPLKPKEQNTDKEPRLLQDQVVVKTDAETMVQNQAPIKWGRKQNLTASSQAPWPG